MQHTNCITIVLSSVLNKNEAHVGYPLERHHMKKDGNIGHFRVLKKPKKLKCNPRMYALELLQELIKHKEFLIVLLTAHLKLYLRVIPQSSIISTAT